MKAILKSKYKPVKITYRNGVSEITGIPKDAYSKIESIESEELEHIDYLDRKKQTKYIFGRRGNIKPNYCSGKIIDYISGKQASIKYLTKGDWLTTNVWYSSKDPKPKGCLDMYVIQSTGWYIKDLNSMNGTKVNGHILPAKNHIENYTKRHKLQRQSLAHILDVGKLLKNGDIITMGIDREYTFVEN